MIRYRTTTPQVEIWIDSAIPNRSGVIQYSGDREAVAIVRLALQNSCGVAGHKIGGECSPIDLSAAMKKPAMAAFGPELLAGGDLVRSYDLGIPKGAQS